MFSAILTWLQIMRVFVLYHDLLVVTIDLYHPNKWDLINLKLLIVDHLLHLWISSNLQIQSVIAVRHHETSTIKCLILLTATDHLSTSPTHNNNNAPLKTLNSKAKPKWMRNTSLQLYKSYLVLGHQLKLILSRNIRVITSRRLN